MLQENAATHLCRVLATRQDDPARRVLTMGCGVVLLVGGISLSTLYLATADANSYGQVAVTWGAWGVATMLVWTMAVLIREGGLEQDASLLSSFRRGRCLEEILGTQMSSRELVDGIAGAAIPRGWELLLRCLPFVAAPALLALLGGSPETALAAGGVLTALGLLLPPSVYLTLAGCAWARLGDEGSGQSVRSLLLLAIVLPAIVVVLGVIILVSQEIVGGWALAAAGLGSLAWATAAGRWAAIAGVDKGEAAWSWLRRLSPFGPRRRANRWVRPWSSNPVVVREAARESRAVPGGPVGAFLVRGGLGLVLGGGGAGLLVAHGQAHDPVLGMLLPILWNLLAVTLFWVALHRALNLVADERESGTLALLVATPLTAARFARGVVSVATRTALVNYFLLAAPLAGTAWLAGSTGWAGLGDAALPLLATLAGAWLGVAAGAPEGNRRRALQRASNLWGGWMLATWLLLIIMLVGLAGPDLSFEALWVGVLALSGTLFLFWTRGEALTAAGRMGLVAHS